MYKETNTRSIVKGISWRVVATGTTMTIVYLFFGNLELAVATGILETVAKIALFWGHEKVWQKIRWGKKRITPFNLWFTGLPLSGKTTVADKTFEKLQKLDIPIERIDSKDIRELIPDIGYTRKERLKHIKRVAHLISTLQKNSVSTVCSFVSPYEESREIVKRMTKNPVIIHIKTDLETCKKRDYKGVYEKALKGEIKNFTGISDIYEEPENADIVIDTLKLSPEEASEIIVKYVKTHLIR